MSARWRGLAISLSFVALLAMGGRALADDDQNRHEMQSSAFNAVLTFDQETPTPPVASSGEGEASFLLSHDGTTLYYTLMATNTSSTVTASFTGDPAGGATGSFVAGDGGGGAEGVSPNFAKVAIVFLPRPPHVQCPS